MVATSGSGWTLAPCLKLLVEQIDDYDASRNKASDGSIGDARHQTTNYSDHNPRQAADGRWYVTAVDISNTDWLDPWILNQLVKDTRVKYIIRKSRYWQRISWDGGSTFTWRSYTGSSPHDKHVHISVQLGAINDLRRWAMPTGSGTAPVQEDDMTPDQAKQLGDIHRWVEESLTRDRHIDAMLSQNINELLNDEAKLTAVLGGSEQRVLGRLDSMSLTLTDAQIDQLAAALNIDPQQIAEAVRTDLSAALAA